MRSTAPQGAQGCEVVRRSRRRSTASPTEHGLARMPALGVVGRKRSRQDASCHAIVGEMSALSLQRSKSLRQDATSAERIQVDAKQGPIPVRAGHAPPLQMRSDTGTLGESAGFLTSGRARSISARIDLLTGQIRKLNGPRSCLIGLRTFRGTVEHPAGNALRNGRESKHIERYVIVPIVRIDARSPR